MDSAQDGLLENVQNHFSKHLGSQLNIFVSNWGPTISDQKKRLENLYTKEFPFFQNRLYCSRGIKKKSDSYHNSRHFALTDVENLFFSEFVFQMLI